MVVPAIVVLFGIGASGVLGILGACLYLRNDKRLIALFPVSILIAIIGLTIRSPQYQLRGGNAADALLGPFVYIFLYATLRYVYKRIYHREPTYNRGSWYDPHDRRRQNIFDVIVYIVPFVLSILISSIIYYGFS